MNRIDERNEQDLLNEQYKDASSFNARINLLRSLGKPPINWYPWIFGLLKSTPDAHVLELGCGPGNLWLENLEKIPPSWEITLSDFSPGMLKEAHANLGHKTRHFTFQLIDAQEIPFEDARFDLAIANLMLYHVPDRPRVFAEIRRVLKADGTFYAATVPAAAFDQVNVILRAADLPTWVDSMSFNLENGEDQLTQGFSHVQLHRLPNTLVITEEEPLLVYIRSILPQKLQNESKLQRVRELLRQELARNGEIRIPMDIGLFEASNQ